jgi:hypothetical protein
MSAPIIPTATPAATAPPRLRVRAWIMSAGSADLTAAVLDSTGAAHVGSMTLNASIPESVTTVMRLDERQFLMGLPFDGSDADAFESLNMPLRRRAGLMGVNRRLRNLPEVTG